MGRARSWSRHDSDAGPFHPGRFIRAGLSGPVCLGRFVRAGTREPLSPFYPGLDLTESRGIIQESIRPARALLLMPFVGAARAGAAVRSVGVRCPKRYSTQYAI
jgi:hypothetical protein